ncbi:hypothetical protein CWI38_0774p0020 [Hamiltosporidium tvaerminnensis]|uniref:Uncharacterized protein n=1 Tax=Hamiltosporidium tvaerminnensis TaxID=1176355 RepID=A0A4Q9LUQ6_9MICR|nr:hypothetical protein CWI38_0774p0020 [Hamiltosporidium tvaerminnensis]
MSKLRTIDLKCIFQIRVKIRFRPLKKYDMLDNDLFLIYKCGKTLNTYKCKSFNFSIVLRKIIEKISVDRRIRLSPDQMPKKAGKEHE